MDVLHDFFSLVCGQNPGHSWAPAGEPLPLCQRCTGLYIGAFIAGFLHLGLRPAMTARFLELHGAFLLLMVPLGFHWIEHGPLMRMVSGVLFGLGLVTFMLLPLGERKRSNSNSSALAYYTGLIASIALLAVLVNLKSSIITAALSGVAFFGLSLLAVLGIVCACLALRELFRWLARLVPKTKAGP